MKLKTLLATLLFSVAMIGCATSSGSSGVSGNSVSTNTVEETTTDIVEEVTTDTVSDNTPLDTSDLVDLNDNHSHDHEHNQEPEDYVNKAYVINSALSDISVECKVPEGMIVHYSDDYAVEFIRPFSDDVGFTFVNEETGATYHDEVIYLDFNNVRNTPFVEPESYLKAQLMNTGYNNVIEREIGDRTFIIAYSEINNVTGEAAMEAFPRTSICCLEVVNKDTPCPEEGCTHTEVLEIFMYLHDLLDEESIVEFIDGVVKEANFSVTTG